jgi:hypothetical protein
LAWERENFEGIIWKLGRELLATMALERSSYEKVTG